MKTYVHGTCACGHDGPQKRPDICGRCWYFDNPNGRRDLLQQKLRIAAGLCRYCDSPLAPNENKTRCHKRPFLSTCQRHSEMNRIAVKRSREKRLRAKDQSRSEEHDRRDARDTGPELLPSAGSGDVSGDGGIPSERTTEIPPPSFQQMLEENCK